MNIEEDVRTTKIRREVETDALILIINSLESLDRETQIRILKCVRYFYNLPVTE